MSKAGTIEKSNMEIRQLYFKLGLALLEQKDFQTAINHLSEALSAKGSTVEDWQIHHLIGHCYASLSYRVLASEHLLRAIAQSPEPTSELFTEAAGVIDRSTTLVKRDWLQKEFLTALGQKTLGKDTRLQCLLLQAQMAIHLDDGVTAYKALEEIGDSTPQVAMLRGEAALLKGEIKSAIKYFTEASESFSKSGLAANADAATICLARAHAENGEYDEAFRLTSDLKNILPNYNYHVRLIDGYYFLKNSKVSDVQKCISQLRLSEYRPLEADLLECRLLLDQKEYKRAEEASAKAAGNMKLAGEFDYLRSRALIESNLNVDEGIKLLQQLNKAGAPLDLFQRRDQCAALDSNGNYHFFHAQLLKNTGGAASAITDALSTASYADLGKGDSALNNGLVLQELLKVQQSSKAAAGDCAETCYQLGIFHYNNSEYREASQWLGQSLQLNDMMKTRWYLIDSLYLDSSLSEPPYVDQGKIAEAESMWEASIKRELPDISFPWAYLLKARIMDSKSKLPGSNVYECYREGWAFAEMATILEPDRYLPWSFIGKFQRLLSVYNNASQSLEKGMKLNADDLYMMEDMAAVYLDTGKYDKADPLLQTLKSRTNDVFYDGWIAFSLYNQFRFDEAISLFKKRVDNDANDFWSRNFLGSSYWFSNKEPQAKEQAQWIWDNRSKATKDQQDIVARAALMLGKLDDSIHINKELAVESDYASGGKYGLLVNYLFNGELDKVIPLLNELVDAGFDERQFGVAAFELKHISERSKKENWRHGEALRNLIHAEKDGLLVRIQNLVKELVSKPPNAFDELKNLLNQDQYRIPGTWGWIDCKSAAARLLLQENRVKEAKEIYNELNPYKEKFHPLKSGIDFITDTFLKKYPVGEKAPQEVKSA